MRPIRKCRLAWSGIILVVGIFIQIPLFADDATSLLWQAVVKTSENNPSAQPLELVKEAEQRSPADCNLFLVRAYVQFVHDTSACPKSMLTSDCRAVLGPRYDADLSHYIASRCNDLVGYFVRSIANIGFDPDKSRADLEAAVRIDPQICAHMQPIFHPPAGETTRHQQLPYVVAASWGNSGFLPNNPIVVEVCGRQGEDFEKKGQWHFAVLSYETAEFAAPRHSPEWEKLDVKLQAAVLKNRSELSSK